MRFLVVLFICGSFLSCNVEDRLLVVDYSYDFMWPKVRSNQNQNGDTLQLYCRYFAYNYRGNEYYYEQNFKSIICDSLRSKQGYTYIYFEFFKRPIGSRKYFDGQHITSDMSNQIYIYEYDEIEDSNTITIFERSDNGYFDDSREEKLGCLSRRLKRH